MHMLTKTRLAASEIAVLNFTYKTQSTNCSVKQDYYHMNVLSKCPWVLGNHCPKDWCSQALTQRNYSYVHVYNERLTLPAVVDFVLTN